MIIINIQACSQSPTIPMNDPICNSDVWCIQGGDVVQLILRRHGCIIFFCRSIKDSKQNIGFVRIAGGDSADQLDEDWLFKQLLKLKDK